MNFSDPRSIPRQRRGAVLIVALILTAIIALALGSYLTLNLTNSRLARQSYRHSASLHVAEAGAEEALWSFNQANANNAAAWSGWTTDRSAAWRKFTGFDFGGNLTGAVKVYVNSTSPAAGEQPTVVALASVEAPDTPVTTRMIAVTLSRRSYFATGIVAKETVRFSGVNTSVDSWNSDPDHDPKTAPVAYSAAVRNDRGGVATLSLESSSMLVNQASIWGYVATGGAAPEVGVQGSIRGADTPSGVRADPARISTDFSADLPAVTAPADGTPIATIGATLGTANTATKWRCANLTLSGTQTLTIQGAVTLVMTASTGAAIDVTGNGAILVPSGSSLAIYAEGDVKIAGNGLGNGSNQPVNCQIWGTSTSAAGQSIQIAGNGALKAVVYAPNADVKINGNGDVMGSLVARTITFTGNADFHYDESLVAGDQAPFGVTRWRELTTAAERTPWQSVLTGW